MVSMKREVHGVLREKSLGSRTFLNEGGTMNNFKAQE